MKLIKVAIIDDNKSIRRIVKELLEMEDDIVFCGEAENMEMGRDLLSREQPDVAIIDVSLNQNDGGFRILEEIIVANLPTKVIMFSAHAEYIYSNKSLKAGAKGYVCKDKTVESLVAAIRCVHAGKEFISKDDSAIA